MNHFCLECGYRFVREAGFFLGAMYFSYVFGAALLAGFTALLKLFVVTDWPLWMVLGPAFLLMLPFIPVLFWYSRVFWFHFEQWVNPL